jgi:hypothetical protein
MQPFQLVQELSVIETVRYQDAILAIIIMNSYREPGVNFCTPDNFSQQLAFIRQGKGKIIEAHVHNPVLREVLLTQEVLHIIKGRLRVDFYDDETNYIESRILISGDTIILVSGGHGFEVLEEIEMIEVKQGPYVGDGDKTRFPGINSSQAVIPEQKKYDTRQ